MDYARQLDDADGGNTLSAIPALDVQVVDNFADPMWRLSNLYWIIDDSGKAVRFSPNPMQLKFLSEMWYLNVISKGRQQGFTTLLCLFMLDACVFTPNINAGIIAHTLDDVKKIFRRKIKYPYEKLPEGIRGNVAPTNDTQNELILSNKSEIGVDTSMRSGTMNFLLISEFGKIAQMYPERAVEIKTGSFNTVHPGNYMFVESTGHGKGGEYYDLVKQSRDLRFSGRPLSPLDFKYHFYPWWGDPRNQLREDDAKQVLFTRQHIAYFAKIENLKKIKLTLEQRAWYVVKKRWNGEEMLREHPSTDDEPFEAVLRGAYFGTQIQEAREQGRITKVPFEKGLPVDTWWDLGMRDKMAIWFVQTIGREYRMIDYHEKSDHTLEWHLKMLTEKRMKLGYHYRHHIGPHDLSVRESTRETLHKTRWHFAAAMGYRFLICPMMDQDDQIEAARNLLPICWFDEENCSEGIAHLEGFRKEWNENLGTYLDKWRHDAHSHCASAFMSGAVMSGGLNHFKPRAQSVGNVTFAT